MLSFLPFNLQDGIQAANSSTQQAIQLVVHHVYEYMVSALAENESESNVQVTRGDCN
jgi:hypothetical protein